MRSSAALPLFVVATALGSCGPRTKVAHPSFPGGGMLAGSTPPAAGSLVAFEALMRPSDDSPFGARALSHATDTTLSFFGEADATYAVLRAGCIEGGARLVLEGTWRTPQNTATGLVRLFAGPAELVALACGGAPPSTVPAETQPTFSGALGTGDVLPDVALSFAFERARVDLTGKFVAIAHRGSCRTIDDCGWSENTREAIRQAEPMGARATELDVHVSKDGIPFLFHDDAFGPRLTAGEFCHGQVADFTLAEIRALCTAKYGETIPTLAEALDTAIDETRLVGVWLDVKTAAAVAPTIAVVRDRNATIAAKKRALILGIGLGDADVLDAYVRTPHDDMTCVCELEPADVRAAGCGYWGPRWTRGPMAGDVASLQAEGRKVFYWTVDDTDFIDAFLTLGRPDGMLSNHPGLVMERVQALGLVPP